jgi:hypothetical protein
LNAIPTDRLTDFPPGIDILASRKAMETLLATTLVLGDPAHAPDDERPTPTAALTDAAKDVANLRKYENQWLRRYDFDVDATHAPPPLTAVGFESVARARPSAQDTGSWGLDPLLATITQLQQSNRDAVIHELNGQGLSLHQRFAVTVAGLTDHPFAAADRSPDTAEKTHDAAKRIWQLIQKIKKEESLKN